MCISSHLPSLNGSCLWGCRGVGRVEVGGGGLQPGGNQPGTGGASAAGEMAPLVSVMSGQSLSVSGPEIGQAARSERPDYLARWPILRRGHLLSERRTLILHVAHQIPLRRWNIYNRIAANSGCWPHYLNGPV